jgi:hypothetical protein
MGRSASRTWAAALLALAGGCVTVPPQEPPARPLPGTVAVLEANPLYTPQGVTFEAYQLVFEHILATLSELDYQILEANVYSGRVETVPRIAPGVLQPLKPGSPLLYDRLLATVQTYRHRVVITTQPAPNGGHDIHVVAFKELEDLPRPVRSTTGGAIFRNDNNIERQYEVIDPTVFESNWIPRGRDEAIEQEILKRLRRCL